MIEGVTAVLGRIREIENLFPPAQLTSGGSGTSFANALASVIAPSTGGGDARVVAAASRYLGVPYRYGGTNPATGLDCSGFVQRVFADLGYQLPRVASDQAQAGTAVASLADAQVGDLVAFGSPVNHIGIYVGDGKMIDAPRTGAVVRIEQIVDTPSAIRRITLAANQAGVLSSDQVGARP